MDRDTLIKFGILLTQGANFYREKDYVKIMADIFIKREEDLKKHGNKYIANFENSKYVNR